MTQLTRSRILLGCWMTMLVWSLVGLMGGVAWAQTPAVPTEFQFLLLPATGDPMTLTPILTVTTTIGPTQNCGRTPTPTPPPTTAVNPLLFEYPDPFTPGKACQLSFPTTIAAGTYQWAGILRAPTCNPTGTATLTPCPGPRAAGVPATFQRVNQVPAPPAPTGLRVSQ